MKKIDLSKTTLRLLTESEAAAVAGAALSGALACGGSDRRTCVPSGSPGCSPSITCAPCSCPGPTYTHVPPC
jgi:hypothetical protein